MNRQETALANIGGALLAVAALDWAFTRHSQPWHGLGLLFLASGRGLHAARELGWTA